MFFPDTSQDNYSVFGYLFAALIRVWGLDLATAIGLGLGHVAWLAALSFAAWRLVDSPWRWMAVALVALYPSFYDGPHRSIAYAESFLTARLWAEPFALAGVAALLARQWYLASLSLAAATLIHPIIALPGLMVATYFLLPARISAWFTLSGVALLAGIAIALGDRQSAFSVMDVDWYVLCRERSPLVFLSNWTWTDFNEPAFLAASIHAATSSRSLGLKRLGRALLATLLVGFAAAAIASQWPITLLLQMQTWRVWWLVKVLGLILVVEWIRRTWEDGRNGKLLACGILAGLTVVESAGIVAAAALVIATMIIGRDRRFELPVSVRALAWMSVGLILWEWLWVKVLALVLTTQGLIANASNTRLTATAWLGGLDDWFRLAGIAALVLALARPVRRRRAAGIVAILAGGISLAAGLAIWDRTNWGALRSSLTPAVPDELAALAEPATNQIYLEGGHTMLWLRLHRASYGSNQQAAGVIFSREGAFEARRRLLHITLINGADGYFARHPEHAQTPARRASADAVRHVCHASALAYIILARPAQALTEDGRFAMQFGGATRYIYDCRRIRQATTDPYPSLP